MTKLLLTLLLLSNTASVLATTNLPYFRKNLFQKRMEVLPAKEDAMKTIEFFKQVTFKILSQSKVGRQYADRLKYTPVTYNEPYCNQTRATAFVVSGTRKITVCPNFFRNLKAIEEIVRLRLGPIPSLKYMHQTYAVTIYLHEVLHLFGQVHGLKMYEKHDEILKSVRYPNMFEKDNHEAYSRWFLKSLGVTETPDLNSR